MLGRLNLSKIEKFRKNFDQSIRFGRPFFQLKEGDSARIRFLPSENEPYLNNIHWIQQGVGFTLICREKDCVCCHYYLKDPAIGVKTSRAAFNIIDARKVHLLREIKQGRETYVTYTCQGPECSFCSQGNEAKEAGVKYWECSTSLALQISDIAHNLRERCLCNTGMIHLVEHICPQCQEPIMHRPDISEFTVCSECQNTVKPLERLKCSNANCPGFFQDGDPWAGEGKKGPSRAGIEFSYLKVTRTGKRDYSLIPEPFSPLEEKHRNYKPLDLKTLLRPPSIEEQARRLEVDDPFSFNYEEAPF